MKRIKRIFTYYQGSLFSVVFISIILTFVLFFFIMGIADVSPFSASIKLYESFNLKNSLYFMPAESTLDYESAFNLEAIESFSAVKDIAYTRHGVWFYNGNGDYPVNVETYPNAAIDAFNIKIDEGTWFSDLQETQRSDTINVIVCGGMFNKVKLGDKIEFLEPISGRSILAHVIGIKKDPVILPNMGTLNLEVNTSSLYNATNNSIIMKEDDAVNLLGNETFSYSFGCFIRLKEDASDVDVTELKNYLSMNGGYNTYEDIIKHSHSAYQHSLRSQLAIQLLLLFISQYAFVSIFVLILNRKSIEMRAYFICGYSKLDCFIDFALSMLFVIAIPCIIYTLFALRIPPILTEFIQFLFVGGENKVIGTNVLSFIMGYFMLSLVLSLVLASNFVRKSSVIDIYKREV